MFRQVGQPRGPAPRVSVGEGIAFFGLCIVVAALVTAGYPFIVAVPVLLLSLAF